MNDMLGQVLKIGALLFFVQPIFCQVHGQEKGIDAPITLQADSIPLREILDAIEAQSGLIFSYSSRLFDDHQVLYDSCGGECS